MERHNSREREKEERTQDQKAPPRPAESQKDGFLQEASSHLPEHTHPYWGFAAVFCFVFVFVFPSCWLDAINKEDLESP